MVEVFKTSVPDRKTADSILGELISLIPSAQINFDLEDCDNILRIDSRSNAAEVVISHLNRLGFDCEELE